MGTNLPPEQPVQPALPERRIEQQPVTPQPTPETVSPQTEQGRQIDRNLQRLDERTQQNEGVRSAAQELESEQSTPPANPNQPAAQPPTPAAPSKTGLEKLMDTLGKVGATLSSTLESLQKVAGRLLSPLVPILMRFGVNVPDFLLPQFSGAKELFAALNTHKRMFEATADDEKNMREVQKIYSDMFAKLTKKEGVTPAQFISDAVAQADPNKEKLTTADIKASATKLAQTMLSAQPASTTAAPTTAPAAAPASPTTPPANAPAAAPGQSPAPAPAAAPAAAPAKAPEVKKDKLKEGKSILGSTPGMTYDQEADSWEFDATGQTEYLFRFNADMNSWEWKYGQDATWFDLKKNPADKWPDDPSLKFDEAPIPESYRSGGITGIDLWMTDLNDTGMQQMREIIQKLKAI